MVWPNLDHFSEVVKSMGTPGVALATKLEPVFRADLITGFLIQNVCSRQNGPPKGIYGHVLLSCGW